MNSFRSLTRASAPLARATSSRPSSSVLVSRLPNASRSLSTSPLARAEKVTRDAAQLDPSTAKTESDTESTTKLMNASYGQADLKTDKEHGTMPGKSSGGQEKPKESGGKAADQKPASSSTTKDHGA